MTITQENVESLSADDLPFPRSYLSYVVCQSLLYPVFTSNFAEVNENCGKHRCVCLQGPKGCGKSFTLAATFAVCHIKNIRCLFLAADSFDNSVTCISYLKEFINSYADGSMDQALKFLDEKDSKSAVETILKESTKQQEPLLVFADLSLMTTVPCLPLINLLAAYVADIRLVLSISSGARHFTAKRRRMMKVLKMLRIVATNIAIFNFIVQQSDSDDERERKKDDEGTQGKFLYC